MTHPIVSPQDVLSSLEWRYATKKFDSTRIIPDDVWQVIEKSLVLTPSSFGLQPWKFFVVRDPQLRQQLLPHSWNQTQVVEASHLVVMAIKTKIDEAEVDHYIQRIAEVRQVSTDSLSGFSKVVKGFLANPNFNGREWAAKQVYIALGQLMTTAAILGIDACPMEGFVPDKYDEVLGLTSLGYAATLLCPLGYRAEDDPYATLAKVRFPQDLVIEEVH